MSPGMSPNSIHPDELHVTTSAPGTEPHSRTHHTHQPNGSHHSRSPRISPHHHTGAHGPDLERGSPHRINDTASRHSSSASSSGDDGNHFRRVSTGSAASYVSENFHHPDGEVGIDPKHKRIVKFVGRVGFMAKAIIYGVLGGLLLRVAAGHGNVDSSPQGVFLLVGDNPVGIPLLIALAACIALYCTWRWWEAFTGQGSDAEYSKKKNFFRYRVSPFVSGAVYAAYDYYVIRTILTAPSERTTESGSETTRSSFPDSWASSGVAGKIGVGFLGCLFLVATLTQWQVVAMGSFKRELYQDKLKRKWLRWLVHGLGYIGFLARGFLFLLVSVLLFRTLANSGGAEFADKQHSITGKAILTMSEEWWGRTILCLVGIGLCLYACFAALNTVFKIYPTPPNSRKPAVDEDKAKEEQEKASSDATEINRQR